MEKQYKSPELRSLGRIEELTLGSGDVIIDFLGTGRVLPTGT